MSRLNEFELIGRLTKSLPTNATVLTGAGDDCAVLDLGMPDRVVLFKTDAVVEGVHFKPDAPPEKVGHKALGRCLSDIAAMAGTPGTALITLGLPDKFEPGRIEAIYAGMSDLARRYEVAIAGGETVLNPGGLLISVALLGSAPRKQYVLRSGAKAGDAIFVTGELGGSLAGRHLEFEPRINEACWLAAHFPPHAMIDLSDGLAGDLRHILRAMSGPSCLPVPSLSAAARGLPRRRRPPRKRRCLRRSRMARTSNCYSPWRVAMPCRCWTRGSSAFPN